MFPLPPRYFPLMLAASLLLAGCATSSVSTTAEDPLQPPPSFCDLSTAPDGAGTPDKKTERP